MLIGLVGVENTIGGTVPLVTVTVNKQSGQADPTSATPILFDIVFSEPVTGFTFSDVFFTGSTAGGTLTCSVSGGTTSYVASVTGMTTDGNVTVVIPAAAAASIATGELSQVSTPIDNIVAWVAPPTTAWYTLYDQTSLLTTASNGWEEYCLAQYIAPAAYGGSVPATCSKIRVTIKTGASGVAFSQSSAGHNASTGDIIDYDGTQIQLLWGGSVSGTAGSNTTRLSDEMTYAFNKTKGLVLRMRFAASPTSDVMAVASVTNYQRTFAIDNSNAYTMLSDVIVDGGTFDLMASGIYLFCKVEVFG